MERPASSHHVLHSSTVNFLKPINLTSALPCLITLRVDKEDLPLSLSPLFSLSCPPSFHSPIKTASSLFGSFNDPLSLPCVCVCVCVCVCKLLSHVQLFTTPWTVALQSPLFMGFSRQEYYSGLPFPSPGDLQNPGIQTRSPTLQAYSLPSEPFVPY